MKKLFEKLRDNQFLTFVIEHYKASELDLSSIAVAYYLLLTMFPFLVLLANIFPYLNINTSQLLDFIEVHLPPQLYDNLSGLIQGVFERPSNSLLWVSIVTGLWTTSQGMIFLQKAINKAYDVQEHRDAILMRLVGTGISALLITFMVLAIFTSTFGESILTLIHHYWKLDQNFYNLLANLIKYLTLAVFMVALGLLYYILPNVRVKRWTNVWPGTLFVSIILLTSTRLFSIYLEMAMQRLEDIRFIGSMALLVLMFWFIFLAKLLIMGAILNSSYQRFYEGELETRRGAFITIIKDKWFKNNK